MTLDADAFIEFERAHWSDVALAFHQGLSALTDRCIPPLLAPLGELRELRVLDVGCGPGHSSAEARRRGASVTGSDLAPNMVSLAGELFPEIEFVAANAESLPFGEGSFDAALGNFVILHVPRPELAAAELARVLKGGGRLTLSTWDSDEANRIFGILFEAAAQVGLSTTIPAAPDRLRFANDAEFRRLLANHGFEDVEIVRFEFVHRVPSAEALFDQITKVSVTAKTLAAKGDVETFSRLRTAYIRLANRYSTGGGIGVPCAAKIASARRRPRA